MCVCVFLIFVFRNTLPPDAVLSHARCTYFLDKDDLKIKDDHKNKDNLKNEDDVKTNTTLRTPHPI